MTDNTQKREPQLVSDDNVDDAPTGGRPRRQVRVVTDRSGDNSSTANAEPELKTATPDEPVDKKADTPPQTARPTETADPVAAETAPEPKRKRGFGRFVTRFILLGVVPIAAIIAGLWYYVNGGRYIETENAYVKTNIIAVSSDIEGRVTEVAVKDNQPINKGDLLFRLDDAAVKLEVAEVDAELAVITSDVDSVRANYREALNTAREYRSELKFLDREAKRQKRLRDRGIGTEQAYDRARTDVEMARDKIKAADESAAQVLATLGGKSSNPASSHPRYVQAEAKKALALDRLKRTEIRAPSSGIVSNMRLQPGEWVSDGTPVFSILQTSQLWIEANLKETQLTNVIVGQTATFKVDTYPNHEFKARVEHIAPATGSEFSLLPPQNATGNWVKVVQRVPVIIAIEPSDDSPPLRAGMTASIAIDTETSRTLPGVIQDLARSVGVPPQILAWFNISA